MLTMVSNVHRSNSKRSVFNKKHLDVYGLKVAGRNALTGAIESLSCRFCKTFGREEKVGAKRKATEHVKHFTVFRTDCYTQHLELQHGPLWHEYQSIKSAEEK